MNRKLQTRGAMITSAKRKRCRVSFRLCAALFTFVIFYILKYTRLSPSAYLRMHMSLSPKTARQSVLSMRIYLPSSPHIFPLHSKHDQYAETASLHSTATTVTTTATVVTRSSDGDSDTGSLVIVNPLDHDDEELCSYSPDTVMKSLLRSFDLIVGPEDDVPQVCAYISV